MSHEHACARSVQPNRHYAEDRRVHRGCIDGELEAIIDRTKRSGLLGYLRGGFEAPEAGLF